MDDRKLLEQAAKAAGINGRYREDWDAIEQYGVKDQWGRGEQWRPHRDDADAFLLMVAMEIQLSFEREREVSASLPDSGYEYPVMWSDHGGNRDSATRRAIVRAAAAMAGGEA